MEARQATFNKDMRENKIVFSTVIQPHISYRRINGDNYLDIERQTAEQIHSSAQNWLTA
jgi:hypothetical protein